MHLLANLGSFSSRQWDNPGNNVLQCEIQWIILLLNLPSVFLNWSRTIWCTWNESVKILVVRRSELQSTYTLMVGYSLLISLEPKTCVALLQRNKWHVRFIRFRSSLGQMYVQMFFLVIFIFLFRLLLSDIVTWALLELRVPEQFYTRLRIEAWTLFENRNPGSADI